MNINVHSKSISTLDLRQPDQLKEMETNENNQREEDVVDTEDSTDEETEVEEEAEEDLGDDIIDDMVQALKTIKRATTSELSGKVIFNKSHQKLVAEATDTIYQDLIKVLQYQRHLEKQLWKSKAEDAHKSPKREQLKEDAVTPMQNST